MDSFVGRILSCLDFIPQLHGHGDGPFHFRQLLLTFGLSSTKSVELLSKVLDVGGIV